MLIIFDLDDTLIDTSGSLTPLRLRSALEILSQSQHSSDQYCDLLQWNRELGSAEKAIKFFSTRYRCSAECEREALSQLRAPLDPDFVVPTIPYAKEILEYFQGKYFLALVTAGERALQLSKLEKAGIDSEIFSKIAVAEDGLKKPIYGALAQEFSKSPDQVWVLGDRIQKDLLPGKELGFRTIHMRWGRGALVHHESWIDYSIEKLEELKRIIP